MRDLPREKLRELIAEHGRSLLNMQGTLSLMLRQQCPQCEPEVQALLLAVQSGVAAEINSLPEGAPWAEASDSLIGKLAGSGNLSDAEARWAVDSWGLALGKHPDAAFVPRELPTAIEKPWEQPQPMNPLIPPAHSVWASAGLWQLIVVALAGFAGGVLIPVAVCSSPEDEASLRERLRQIDLPLKLGIFLSADGEIGFRPQGQATQPKQDNPQPGPKIIVQEGGQPEQGPPKPLTQDGIRLAIQRLRASGVAQAQDAANILTLYWLKHQLKPDFLYLAAFLGAAGGLVGALLGFILGGAGRVTFRSARAGTAIGKVGLGSFWAFQAAMVGCGKGLMREDPVAVFLFCAIPAAVGGLLGAFIGKHLPVLFYCWVGLIIVNHVWRVVPFFWVN